MIKYKQDNEYKEDFNRWLDEFENRDHNLGLVFSHKDEDGHYHNIDGPAVEYDNGTKKWFIHGKLHRENGPAIIWNSGNVLYFLNGIELSEKDYQKALLDLKMDRLKDL